MGCVLQQEQQAAAPVAAPPSSPPPAAALTLLEVLAGGIDVTRYLLEFLKPREQRRLLNTSRQLADMKKHLLYWTLTKARYRIFYAQPSFRSQLETLVHNPSQQLCLRFYDDDVIITDVSALGDVHTLFLQHTTHLGTMVLLACNEFTRSGCTEPPMSTS
jgi:hypothetical protein